MNFQLLFSINDNYHLSMEQIKNSDFRFEENQKIKLYQFMAQTESKTDNDQFLHILKDWRIIIQNAQQPKQLRDLYLHKIEPSLLEFETDDEKLKKRIEHLKKLTESLWV